MSSLQQTGREQQIQRRQTARQVPRDVWSFRRGREGGAREGRGGQGVEDQRKDENKRSRSGRQITRPSKYYYYHNFLNKFKYWFLQSYN